MKLIYLKSILTLLIGVSSLVLYSCESTPSVEKFTEQNILVVGNSSEPQGLDPHVVSGVLEGNIIRALFEGLCLEDQQTDGVSIAGAAVSWIPNDDFTEWTFKLQPEGKWSDGEPVTTEDFIFSYHRILNPKFAAEYAAMLHYITNGQDYNSNHRSKILASHLASLNWEEIKDLNLRGEPTDKYNKELKSKLFDTLGQSDKEEYTISKGLDRCSSQQLQLIRDGKLDYNFPQSLSVKTKNILLDSLIEYHDKDLWDIAKVGVTAKDSHTLVIKLRTPIPFLPDITKHYTWFPTPKHVILEKGSIDDPQMREWTNPGNMVSNGAFKLKEWKLNHVIEVTKNPHYWDASTVSLSGIRFLPISNQYTETRMFFAGQLHQTYGLPAEMIEYARKKAPSNLHQDTHLNSSFLRFNVTDKSLENINLRKALSFAIDSNSIIKNVLKGGQTRATGMVPPMGEYTPAGITKFDLEIAKKYLKAFESETGTKATDVDIVLLTVSKETSKTQAEAYKDMWKKNLGISVTIEQAEWATYLDRMGKLDYGITTGGWTGDFNDPTTFLDMWKKDDGNNRTGWSSEEYEKLLAEAALISDQSKRLMVLKKAEKLFLNEAVIIPISWSTSNYLMVDNVKGRYPLLLNNPPYKFIRLEK